MADFLARLAGRTLGVVPTVQPMIAPMYAPDPALLAGQAGLPVFEEISGSVPGQPLPWPAGQESIDLPEREPLQAAPAAQGQEEGANLFANPTPISLRHVTTFPPAGVTQAGATQLAPPPVSGDISVNSQHMPPSIFVTSEGGLPGTYIALSSTFTTGEGGVSGTARHIPLSSISMAGEGVRPGAGAPLPSQFITREGSVSGAGVPLPSQSIMSEGGQPGADTSFSLSAAPLPAPDKTSPLQMQEVRTLPSQPVQGQLENASFARQDYQGSDVPHTVIDVNSVERQRTAGYLPQSALSADSHSRASMRQAAADAATNRHELSTEGAALATPAAPTIQVTIGRIEVRATQPPPAQRQAPRPGPRMVSLEEYLNQQAKGGQ
jgi:hypothetical protein